MLSIPALRLSLGAAAAVVLLAGCAAPADPVASPEPTGEPFVACPAPQPNAFGGAAVVLDSAELLGADDLPADVCAYGSESGESIWIIAAPYDAEFPDRVAAWLEPLGWTAEEVGTWGDGDLQNVAFTPPAGTEIASAFAHAFSAYPDSVSFNMGLDQEFLSHYGVEVGDELAIFAAWR